MAVKPPDGRGELARSGPQDLLVAGGLQSGPPPPALSLWSGPLSGGPLVRGCLQIIREQIRKGGGKKALRRQTGSLSSGVECQRQESCTRGPAFAAREGRRRLAWACWGGRGQGGLFWTSGA